MKISVVLPTYNEENNIERCIDYILKQTYKDYEIIIVDGGSTDKTVEIAKNYTDKVIPQQSKGIGGARNDGVAIASGEIVAMIDADNYLPSNWLEVINDSFTKHPDVTVLFGPLTALGGTMFHRFFLGLFNMFAYLLGKTHLYHCTVGGNTAFRRDAFLKSGGYSALPAYDDYEIVGKFRKKKLGKILYDRRMVTGFSMRRYEQHGSAATFITWLMNTYLGRKGKKAKLEYARQKYK